jgi:hypothetical protein
LAAQINPKKQHVWRIISATQVLYYFGNDGAELCSFCQPLYVKAFYHKRLLKPLNIIIHTGVPLHNKHHQRRSPPLMKPEESYSARDTLCRLEEELNQSR